MLSGIQLFATRWTVVRLCLWDAPDKNTGVSCHFLLQGMFPTQGSNLSPLCFLHWLADSLQLSHLGSPGCIWGQPRVLGQVICRFVTSSREKRFPLGSIGNISLRCVTLAFSFPVTRREIPKSDKGHFHFSLDLSSRKSGMASLQVESCFCHSSLVVLGKAAQLPDAQDSSVKWE